MIYAALVGLALAGVAIVLLWRKVMTLQESLASTVAFVTEQRQKLQEAVAAIPGQVSAALDKALADYAAAHPDSVPNLDGVTRESLTAAMQSITDDARSVLNNADAIPVQIADATPTGG